MNEVKTKRDLISSSMKVAQVFREARMVCERWGYSEIVMPSLDKESPMLKEGLRTLVDGEVYRVHPDSTSHLLNHLKGHTSVKLFYCAEVLDFHAKSRWQIGAESIREAPFKASVEMMNVVISLLEKLGIHDFLIDIGSMAEWERHMTDIPEHRDTVWKAIRQRNFGLIEELPIPHNKKQELWALLNTRTQTPDQPEIHRLLQSLDDHRLYMDMGTIRFLPYYNELVFEVYVPTLGVPIGGGGRYRVNGDTGFGFALDASILAQLSDSSEPLKREVVEGKIGPAFKRARELVLSDVGVEVRAWG